MSEAWVGTGVAAQLLGLTAQGVRERIARGELVARRRGKSWELPLSALQPASDAGAGAVGQLAGAVAEALAERLETATLAAVEEAIGDVRLDDALARQIGDLLAADQAAAVEAGRREARALTALDELAAASWWRRRRLVGQLRAEGLLRSTSRA